MLIRVRVKTKAKKESVRKLSEGQFEVSVREKPELNMANKRMLELVAEHLGLPASKLRLIKGQHRPSKLLSVSLS